MDINIRIGDKTYQVPEEVTAAQWALISVLPWDQHHTIQTILGVSRFELVKLTPEETQQVYEYCSLALKGLQYDDSPMNNEDFDKMTFGQWVDTDVWAHTDPNVNIVEITNRLTDEDTMDWPLSKAVGLLKAYLKWRAKVYETYANLFGLSDKEEGDVVDKVDQDDIRRIWYEAIMVLSNEDFDKMDAVTDKPLYQALNFLAYKKEKADKQLRELKQMQKTK